MSPGPRMRPRCAQTNAVDGTVRWDPVKSLWFTGHMLITLVFAVPLFSWSSAWLSCGLTCLTMCAGHSVGMHRLLIHRSFECPVWLERLLVTLGTLVGMGGPKRMLLLHDIRDWSQRQHQCHAFYIHKSGWLRDAWWNLHCRLDLEHPPHFEPEARTDNLWYRTLDAAWMLLQLPLAVALYVLGGWSFVVWGISLRIVLSLTGHWLVGYLAHNGDNEEWHVNDAAVQGHNVPGLGLLTFGEAWHNNHHAFPDSARLGLKPGQSDPGWWLLTVLEGLGLVWNLQQPADLPHRPELQQRRQSPDVLSADPNDSPPVVRKLLPVRQ
ncbi:MAG: acyl-CoA desaturase [Planctomycetaceae bacterium]|nr:acyl-CoA desaturase [Planctomycetaceae bacterium]